MPTPNRPAGLLGDEASDGCDDVRPGTLLRWQVDRGTQRRRVIEFAGDTSTCRRNDVKARANVHHRERTAHARVIPCRDEPVEHLAEANRRSTDGQRALESERASAHAVHRHIHSPVTPDLRGDVDDVPGATWSHPRT